MFRSNFITLVHWIIVCLRAFCYGTGCKKMLFYPKQNGRYLQHHVTSTMTASSSDDCELYCYMNDRCQSFNYRAVNSSCEINHSDHFQHPYDLLNETDYEYFATKNNCSVKPCPANSVCHPNFVTGGHTCECLKGFHGPQCQDIDECTRGAVCPANSVCANTPGSYLCHCTNGYSKVGDRCLKTDAIYDITVYTAKKWGAGTNSKITATITGMHFGDEESYGEIQLQGKFEYGNVDKSSFYFMNLNPITKLKIRTAGSSYTDQWDLHKIEIKNHQERTITTFECNCEFQRTDTKTLPPTQTSKY